MKRLKYKKNKRFRLPAWDYSENGYYFVTICTKNHINYFGEIKNKKMYLSQIGRIAKKYLLEIPNHFEYTFLDVWQIMPNHVHAIIIINHDYVDFRMVGTGHCPVPTGKPRISKFGKVVPNSLSIMIGCYKTSVTKYCRWKDYNNFTWQARFYDHIIRDEKDLYNVREYITNNPLNWELDRNYPENMRNL